MEKLKDIWLEFYQSERETADWWERKKVLCEERDAKIVRIKGDGHIFQKIRFANDVSYRYLLHVSFFIKQMDRFYIEEDVTPYTFRLVDGEIRDHKRLVAKSESSNNQSLVMDELQSDSVANDRFTYNRHDAVQYAERWWNSYNPAYRKFDVDCTNYVSQCLHAGGAPMRGAPVREKGWWYQGDNWSFSWAVAHSLRWYLSGSTQGLKGKEVESASELIPGDVICYDFQGDGRWDHNTIVVTKDELGMPLVNAHTDNSRNRYWSYEDSTAYTTDIKYKFFRIGE
ncbi:amidase domain-containing protein [Virgibacillus sp. C22-A2]|uniref:Amidase domain-containing protein n=1 Tax=Virgibacillus tibetensis TaxID=3042313 RepID=A0ABU6KF23_9BACI|nr:amidase domain-containing protein [Virgibacillus sp. C22-A2]